MKDSSPELRKNLFPLVERPSQGKIVEVAHQDRVVRPLPAQMQSKTSRLVQRDTIQGTPEDLERAQQQLDAEMRKLSKKKWAAAP
jgi:hypothetical protein